MPSMTINANKDELLNKLNENKANHRAQFEKAVAEWRDAAVHEIDNWKTQLIENGRVQTFRTTLIAPEDHSSDYDRVIAMVNMHVNGTFALNEQQFQQYVQDAW